MTTRADVIDNMLTMINMMDGWDLENLTASEFDCLEDILVRMQQLVYLMGGEE